MSTEERRRYVSRLKSANGVRVPEQVQRSASLPSQPVISRSSSGVDSSLVCPVSEGKSYTSLTLNQQKAIQRQVVKDVLVAGKDFRGETTSFKGGLPESCFKIAESGYLSGKRLRKGDKKRGAYLICPIGKPLKKYTPVRLYGESIAVEGKCGKCDEEDPSRLRCTEASGKKRYWPCPECINKLVIHGDRYNPDYFIDGKADWSVMANHNAVDPDMALAFYRQAPYGIPVAILFSIKEQPGDGKPYEKTWDYYHNYA
jgi:hypothetical protein